MKRVLMLAAAMLASLAVQAEYPEKTIRLVVPFGAGGVTDTSGRVVAEALGRRLGQSIVVENKAGASGNIGTQLVALAPPDGYTLVLGFDGTLVINPHVFANFPIDVQKDLAPVGKIGDATLIIVAHPSFPAKTLQELIAHAKKDPKGVSYGTSGVGGTPHIAGELLKQKTGANLQHVPYKGGGPAMTDLLGGRVSMYPAVPSTSKPHIDSGKIKEWTKGDDPDAEITLSMSYEDSVKMQRGELDPNAAFMQGRIKVVPGSNMGKLMSLLPLTQSPEYKAIQSKVDDITEY